MVYAAVALVSVAQTASMRPSWPRQLHEGRAPPEFTQRRQLHMQPRKAHVRALVVMAVLMLVCLCLSTQRTTQAVSQPVASQSLPAEASWPRRFETNGHVVLLYQTQVDAEPL